MITPILEFKLPTMPDDMQARDHNRYVKKAVRETLLEHWRQHTRRHFQIGASSRYGYAQRSPRYNAEKKRQFGHTIPMLRTGKTRDKMAGSTPQLRIGGAAEGGKKGITGSYRLKFPFDAALQQNYRRRLGRRNNRPAAPRRNVMPQLRREMEAWAADEIRLAARGFAQRYWQSVRNHRGGQRRYRCTP
jgi:hypothetical protein